MTGAVCQKKVMGASGSLPEVAWTTGGSVSSELRQLGPSISVLLTHEPPAVDDAEGNFAQNHDHEATNLGSTCVSQRKNKTRKKRNTDLSRSLL